MSLQVWLPLTNDTNNIGIIGQNITTAFTNTVGGKIGNCYHSSATTSAFLPVDIDKLNTSSISIGGWFKFNKAEIETVVMSKTYTSTASAMLSTILGYAPSTTGGFSILWRTNNIYTDNEFKSLIVYGILRTTTAGARTTTSVQIEFDTWYSIYLVFDRQKDSLLFYVNGDLIQELSVPEFSDIRSGNITINSSGTAHGNFYNGRIPFYMNDVRIYDNALSSLEVKEISQGLVLHYPLNKINKNLFTYNGLTEYNQEFQLADYQNTGSFKQFNNCMPSTNLVDTVGSYFTISLDAISPNGTTQLLIYNSNSDPRYFYYSTTLTTSLGNEWQHFTYTFQNEDRGDTHFSTIYHPIEVYMPNKMGGKIRNVKIEFGTAETIWTSYTDNSMETIIADCSGYNRNGTVMSPIVADIDTARYDRSTLFDGITSGFSFVDGGISTVFKNAFTLSFWAKGVGENGARSIYFASNGSGNPFINFEKYSNNKLFIAWGNSTTSTIYDAIYSTADILDGNWYHICIVASSLSNLKIYINGNLDTTSSVSRYDVPIIDNKIWRIGRDTRSGDGTPFHGNMSDFRLYATALSEEDILALYKTSARIDNAKNMHTYEIEELSDNYFTYEKINSYKKSGSTTYVGEIVTRNGDLAYRIAPGSFYPNYTDSGGTNRAALFVDEFKANTSYVFDIYMDTDEVVYQGNNVSGGLIIHYTDNTTTYLLQVGSSSSPLGFKNTKVITPSTKTISYVEIYYHVSIPVYYRLDSSIYEYKTLQITKRGTTNTSQITEENNTTSILNGGGLYTNEIIEM